MSVPLGTWTPMGVLGGLQANAIALPRCTEDITVDETIIHNSSLELMSACLSDLNPMTSDIIAYNIQRVIGRPDCLVAQS